MKILPPLSGRHSGRATPALHDDQTTAKPTGGHSTYPTPIPVQTNPATSGVVPPTFNLNSMPGYAGVIELVCGILLVLGLFTRPAAFLASGMTAVAYFLVHAPQGFFPILNKGELAVLYCFVFLYLAAAGAGPWSVDALRRK